MAQYKISYPNDYGSEPDYIRMIRAGEEGLTAEEIEMAALEDAALTLRDRGATGYWPTDFGFEIEADFNPEDILPDYMYVSEIE